MRSLKRSGLDAAIIPSPREAGRGSGLSLLFAALALLLCLAPAPARAVTVEKVTSPGGITAWLVQDHSIAVVSMRMLFLGGGALDPPGKEGLATLTADLLDEGAGDLDSTAYQQRFEDLASSLDFEANADTLDVSVRTITASAPEVFDLLRLALTEPRFDAPAVLRVRSQLIGSLERSLREPNYISARQWWQTVYPEHPYGRPLRGTPASVARIAVDDMRQFVRERIARDTMLIAIVGDMTPQTCAELLDKSFGVLPAHAAPAEVAEVTADAAGQVTLAKLPIPQSVVTFGQPGIKRDDPDWFAAYLINYVLGGGGLTSRLALEIREKRGLAYSIGTGLDPFRHSGVWVGTVATENSRVEQSIELVRAEWKRMKDQGPTEAELADAKTYLTGSFPLSLDSTDHIAQTLVSIQRDGLGIDYLDRRSALINAVTLADAKRVAERLLDPAALSFSIVGAPPEIVGARTVNPGG